MQIPFSIPLKISRRVLLFIAILVPIVLLSSLPLIAHTSTYPLAVVNGNSMVPALLNGDLVYYTAPHGPVKNGTIIVFIQGETGVNSLDALLKPIVIHRVIGFGYEPDGSLYYETKGDNNQAADPFVTPASSVLGVESVAIPYAGLPVEFFQSAYGMLTVVASMSLYFFSGVDTRMWEEDERKRLITVFATHSLDGSIGSDQFEKLKMVVECSDIPEELLKDSSLLSMAQWLKEGGLVANWREETGSCPKCGASAYHVVGKDNSFVVCPQCMSHDKQVRSAGPSPVQRASWAERLFSRPSSQGLLRQQPQDTRAKTTRCGVVCPGHKVPCVLRKGHLKSHHHMNLGGSFCFFDQ
jgi:signal peptidase I